MRDWTRRQKRLIRRNFNRIQKELKVYDWARVWVKDCPGNWASESFVVRQQDLERVRCW